VFFYIPNPKWLHSSSVNLDCCCVVLSITFFFRSLNVTLYQVERIYYGAIAIHPRFTKRISSLRTAGEKGEGSLDKDATSDDDLFDAFRLSMMFWRRRA
jgi:hypothetical protein